MALPVLPDGTVTLLFTDIQGSTNLLGGDAAAFRLALIDLRTGRAAPPRTVCAAGEGVSGLAMEPAGGESESVPTVYLVIRRESERAEDGDCSVPTGSRLVALDARTGAELLAERVSLPAGHSP